MFKKTLPDSKLVFIGYVGDGFDGSSHCGLQTVDGFSSRMKYHVKDFSSKDRLVLGKAILQWVEKEMKLRLREGQLGSDHTLVFGGCVESDPYQLQYVAGALINTEKVEFIVREGKNASKM